MCVYIYIHVEVCVYIYIYIYTYIEFLQIDWVCCTGTFLARFGMHWVRNTVRRAGYYALFEAESCSNATAVTGLEMPSTPESWNMDTCRTIRVGFPFFLGFGVGAWSYSNILASTVRTILGPCISGLCHLNRTIRSHK